MNNRFALALGAILLAGGSASAADMGARKAPPMAAPVAQVYNWTGFYFGGHAGWGWNENDSGTSFVPGGAAFAGTGVAGGAAGFGVSNDTDGGMLGAQIGVNYQISTWVVGIEADLSWVDWDRGYTVGPLLTAGGVAIPGSFQTASGGMDWFGTVRGRLGFAANNLLVYVTGGFAFGDTDHTVTTSFLATGGGVFTASGGDTRAGYTIGGGFEWGFAPNWSVKAEYLYYDLGDTTISSTIGASTVSTSFDNDGHIARIGLNYRFGYGAPVVARY